MEIQNKHVVLELDTFQIGENGPIDTAYCVIDQIPIDSISNIAEMLDFHQQLTKCYQAKDWKVCLELITKLMGSWNGELDTFYNDLESRIKKYNKKDPGPDWSYIIIK